MKLKIENWKVKIEDYKKYLKENIECLINAEFAEREEKNTNLLILCGLCVNKELYK